MLFTVHCLPFTVHFKQPVKNLIGITMGDPKGIGPEIIIKALQRLDAPLADRIIIYGDSNVFEEAYKLINSDSIHLNFKSTSNSKKHPNDMSDREAAEVTLAALNQAMEDAKNDKLGAIVTAPVNKSRLNLVCPNFIGHTEYLASASEVQDPTMIFITENARNNTPVLSLVTTHAPIADLPSLITHHRVLSTIIKTSEVVRDHTGRNDISIAVASFNPHAGEDGLLGREEIDVIKPAIADVGERGIDCKGPFPADGLFNQTNFSRYDGIVAMYHDQGLAPLKALGLEKVVNFTVGLPYTRTSPAHGTAEDIAWKGLANESSLLSAIGVANRYISRNRRIENHV